jgi:hypothetical protein
MPNKLLNITQVTIKGKVWSFVKQLQEYQLWSADYWCPDGDGVQLYISNDKDNFELECFSGTGMSRVIIHGAEFTYLQGKVKELDFKEPFEMQCVKIADYLCGLFCEYKDVSTYNVTDK